MGPNTVVVEARDGNANVATKTYSVTTTGTSKTYDYDANGNLRYEKQPNGAVIREYRWDQQNRLVRMLSGAHESVYDYDGQSRRIRITEKENSVQTKQETFIWCGSRICQTRSGSTVVRSYFAQGFEQGSDDYFYTRDHLGSIREVLASDGTTVASRVSYDPWGKPTETGAGALTDFGFTSHYLDRPSGLNLPMYRGYSPSLGRWLSRDPIGLRGGFNLYGYVHNDPANRNDPSGLADLFFTLDLDLVGFTGVEINAGVVYDTDHPLESGFFLSSGIGTGANVGWGLAAGAVFREIEGLGTDLDINAGKVSPVFYFDDQGFNGAALGIGPGIGLSYSASQTWTWTIGDIFRAPSLPEEQICR